MSAVVEYDALQITPKTHTGALFIDEYKAPANVFLRLTATGCNSFKYPYRYVVKV